MTNAYGHIDLPPEVLAKVDGLDIIEGGTFVGDTIPVFRENFPKSVAYCFEPGAAHFEIMNSIFKQEIKRNFVKPMQMGLGNQPQTMTLKKW